MHPFLPPETRRKFEHQEVPFRQLSRTLFRCWFSYMFPDLLMVALETAARMGIYPLGIEEELGFVHRISTM